MRPAHALARRGGSAGCSQCMPGSLAQSPVVASERVGAARSSAAAPRTVVRERLIRALAQTSDAPVVLIVAPVGYGKTTLLSQWARHDSRPFGVVAMRTADNDPRHLLESIARALSELAPVEEEVFIALSRPGGSHAGAVLAPLGRWLAGREPFVLALDDVGVLAAPEALAT